MKFRKKPVVVEAIQFLGNNFEVAEWAIKNNGASSVEFKENGDLLVHTLENTLRAQYGDWIIKGVKGEFYPCKPDIFEATYMRESE